MPEDKELVPLKDERVTSEIDANTELGEVFTQMSQLLQIAVTSFMYQNVRDVDMAARTAEALYDDSQQGISPDDLFLLGILKNLLSLYAPLTRVIVFQNEGRFARAREEVAKGLATSDNAMTNMEQYIRLPGADPEMIKDLIQIYKPMFAILTILFRGYDAYIRAEIVGYQGDIPRYKELLREAVTELRQAERLPSTLNPMILALVNFWASIAERWETRIEVFSSEQRQRYLSPTGNKIFIIHGHDEAKWRELRELLEDQLNQKTIVLREEPGAGETLIRKFEEFADDCGYAFALLTPDDFVEKEGKSYMQARPNVLFELGWFYGRFGRDRVCIVKKANTEMPSDLAGILSIDFHKDISEGFLKLQAELRRVGLISTSTQRQTRRSTGRAKKQRAGEL